MTAQISPDFVPQTAEELEACLSDPMWRVCSGQLYKIIVKSNEADEGKVMPFRPNRAQRRFIKRLWHRNIILKARQLGFTTLICILWLDHAMFNANQRCGIIAQDKIAAQAIFRDKVKFAYDNLPAMLRKQMPLQTESVTELLFAHNNSSFKVATSVRGGTIDRLHISEFGKICAKYPAKASEVMTGSLPAVPMDGIAIIESTAEGRGGAFHAMTEKAEELAQQGKKLTAREWRFHFFPWFEEPGYEMDPEGVIITAKDHLYFDELEAKLQVFISKRKRAWYVATRDADFAGEQEKMWQEYPSTPAEAFQQSTEGCYYTVQLTRARKEGRITTVPHTPGVPVNTFWDIGSRDGTAIWFHQRVGTQDRFIGFEEGWGEPYGYFTGIIQAKGWTYGTHYLPHDAEHKRQQAEKVAAPIDMLEDLLPNHRFEIVPRVEDVLDGIQLTRDAFANYWFDEEACKDGLTHLSGYRKEWDSRTECWKELPFHNEDSEAADALRQHAQGYNPTSRKKVNRKARGHMAA